MTYIYIYGFTVKATKSMHLFDNHTKQLKVLIIVQQQLIAIYNYNHVFI